MVSNEVVYSWFIRPDAHVEVATLMPCMKAQSKR